MTRRGVFSSIMGFIVGLFGTARVWGIQKSEESRTYIIHSSDICAGEYPNIKSWEEKVTTSNPEVIKFLDSFLMKVYPNREGNFIWKQSVRIEYASGQFVETKPIDVRVYYLSYFVPDKNKGHYELVPFSTENKEIIRVMEQRLGMATVIGRSFDSWVPRILSQQDLDSNDFVDDPRLAWWKRWAPEPTYEYKRLGIKVSTPLEETKEYLKKHRKYFSSNN